MARSVTTEIVVIHGRAEVQIRRRRLGGEDPLGGDTWDVSADRFRRTAEGIDAALEMADGMAKVLDKAAMLRSMAWEAEQDLFSEAPNG